ncbi:TPA: hypothetical protein N0F65_003804 [Lagenidium giganteum]|uniref:Cilia- and flagella-associated protein 157 n=1 Tax=Lagenidium giganteum TaxID=4803 RepID=A0AAV2YY91_9STRA|nr:TPA: hypothetical protein N0F65_003804 [Lagenidium giganteum]
MSAGNSAGASAGGGGVLTAADFFGKDDSEGVEKFKIVAFRALQDQKMHDELSQTRLECENLRRENAALAKQLKDTQTAMQNNIEDRERVLAFKSKRIEELLSKIRDCESVNLSLLQTINGGNGGIIEGMNNARASMMLVSSGKPLFHAIETCKEQEFRRLYEDKRNQFEHLSKQCQANDALVQEMKQFQVQKKDLETQLRSLETLMATMSAEKDEKIHFLERKLVFEHDRLKREKEVELQACQETMEKQMRTQLDVTTQRTIEENEYVQLELRYQSAQLEKMLRQMDQIRQENRSLTHEKELFQEMNATLSRKIKFYEQLFSKMQQEKDRHRTDQTRQDDTAPSGTMDLANLMLPLDLSPPRRAKRKPPIPSNGRRSSGPPSAFGSPSPPSSPLALELPDHFNNGSGLDQLNSATNELDRHLQRREFEKTQLSVMMYRHHRGYSEREERLEKKTAAPGRVALVKKKVMLAKECYSPKSYPRGRKLRELPVSLDSFIKENSTISPRAQRKLKVFTPPSSSNSGRNLPSLSVPASDVQQQTEPRAKDDTTVDVSSMWKVSTDAREEPQTARF